MRVKTDSATCLAHRTASITHVIHDLANLQEASINGIFKKEKLKKETKERVKE